MHPRAFSIRSVGVLAFVFACLAPARVALSQTTVFHGATLIDGIGSVPLRDAFIVVNDSTIACVGSRADCSTHLEREGVRLVDLSGAWIIPGLIDTHVHVTAGGVEQNLRPLLQAGVTTVRDVGAWGDTAQHSVGHGEIERIAALTDRVWRGTTPGPRIRYCGPGLYSSDSDQYTGVPNFIRLQTGSDVAEVVGYLVDRGASCIKLYSGARPDHMEAVLTQAAVRGVPGIGHSSLDLPLGEQLEWPWQEVHHQWFSAEDLLLPEWRAQLPMSRWARLYVAWARFDAMAPEVRAITARIAERRIAWVPTLAVIARTPYETWQWDLIRAGAGPGDSLIVSEALFGQGRVPRSAADSAAVLRAAASRFAALWVRALRDAGVSILAGSDSPNPAAGLVLGTALHDELENLVDAGLSPLEALAAATRDAASALGLGDRLGTLTISKLADFVVLDADPLSDIRNTRAVRFVVFGGDIIEIDSPASVL